MGPRSWNPRVLLGGQLGHFRGHSGIAKGFSSPVVGFLGSDGQVERRLALTSPLPALVPLSFFVSALLSLSWLPPKSVKDRRPFQSRTPSDCPALDREAGLAFDREPSSRSSVLSVFYPLVQK